MRYTGSYYYKLRSLGHTDPTPKYYVYLLLHPVTHQVFYVGKGTGRRMYQHLNDVKQGRLTNGVNGKLFRALHSLISSGLQPLYEKPQENITEIEALALEAAFIDYYGIDNLCNYQASGFGCTNHSETVKVKCGYAAHKQNHPEYKGTLEDYIQLKHFNLIVKRELGIRRDIIWFHRVRMKEEKKQKRTRQKANQKANDIASLLLVSMDDEAKEYVRKCPSCFQLIVNHHKIGFMQSARKRRVCRECTNKKLSTSHKAIASITSKRMKQTMKRYWQGMSASERQRQTAKRLRSKEAGRNANINQ